ncbi:glycosyltransferase family 2 protein [Bacteroides mediterraneensis]|uniref:glycosyltransferase family 2 protein n=1 Tax=Bacteroides mediterraneensis TaxID=1841856 RepID=UPI000934DBA0|nr:glycosyltransferase family 2 protein [Bacteroides mediterraneensis]
MKKLSIVIPTLNRYEYLRRTIEVFLPQIKRNIENIQFVVCANCCNDNTDTYMKNLCKENTFIEYYYYNQYAEVGESIIRSVEKCTSEYVIIWGDDDLPYPFLIDYLLNTLNEQETIGIIHINRLYGKDTIYGIKDLGVKNTQYESMTLQITLPQLIDRFTIDLGFISSIVFRLDAWNKGKNYFSPSHYGYEFLAIILMGTKKLEAKTSCLYINLPMEIQRNPLNRDFSAKWPLYMFVGVPNMMSDFDKWGISEGAYKAWCKNKRPKLLGYIWNMAYTSIDRSFYKTKCRELNKYQQSKFRRILTYIIVYTFPKNIFKFIKGKLYS